MKKDDVMEVLTSKERELRSVIYSSPSNLAAPWLLPIRQRRIENARFFLAEIVEVKQLLQISEDIYLVPFHILRQKISSSKNYDSKFSGHFCKFAIVTDSSDKKSSILAISDVNLL